MSGADYRTAQDGADYRTAQDGADYRTGVSLQQCLR